MFWQDPNCIHILYIYIYIHTTYIPEIQDRYRKYQRLNGEVHFPTKASFFCYPFFNFWLKLCNLILSPKKTASQRRFFTTTEPPGWHRKVGGSIDHPTKGAQWLAELGLICWVEFTKKTQIGCFFVWTWNKMGEFLGCIIFWRVKNTRPVYLLYVLFYRVDFWQFCQSNILVR